MLIDKLVRRVQALNLDLKGKTVVTEAASGAYVVTPVLAALAGAKVFAFTRTTRYGTREEVIANTKELIAQYGDKLDITFPDVITDEIIAQADMITNSGHLRPLSASLLKSAKDSLVIPLMYEAWEWRDADMEIGYIRERGFKLGATNERHPEVDVFSYLGDMAIKQIFDAGLCLYKNKFVLLCNNDFGPYIAKVVAKMCDDLAVIDKDENKSKYDLNGIDWIGGFPNVNLPEKYRDAEAVIFTAYPFDQSWMTGGDKSPISIKQLKQQIKDPFVLRYCGDVPSEALDRESVRYFPANVHSGHMGILPSAIGNDPIIRLQAGGLKAGELLMRNETTYQGLPLLELM